MKLNALGKVRRSIVRLVVEPTTERPLPQDILTMRVALHRLYWRAIELAGQEVTEEAPQQGWQALRGASESEESRHGDELQSLLR